MNLTYDPDTDTAYLDLVGGAHGPTTTYPHTIAPGSDVLLDFDRDGRLLGIEFLEASKQLRREVLLWP